MKGGVLAVAMAVAALVLGTAVARSDVAGTYTVHNLSSNVPGLADKLDPDLQNGWGIAEPAAGPWWVADNGSDKSTLYAADGTKNARVVSIADGVPTGVVFNGTGGFPGPGHRQNPHPGFPFPPPAR